MANTHIVLNLNKKEGEWDFVHDEILDRISKLFIECPECESIIHSDEQYQCMTCGGNQYINVLDWIKKQGKQISLDDMIEKAIEHGELLGQNLKVSTKEVYITKALKDIQ